MPGRPSTRPTGLTSRPSLPSRPSRPSLPSLPSLLGLVGLVGLVLAQLTAVVPAAAAPAPPVPSPAAGQQGQPERPVQPTIPQRYLDQTVTWQTCGFDASIRRLAPTAPSSDCATVVVPMDWTRPEDHSDITVAISYSYATGSSRGLLTANPGGPGTPARSFTAALAVDHPELFAQYDLLGMDPRGYGDSQRLTCTASAATLSGLPTTRDPRRRGAATHAAEEESGRLLAQACSSQEMAAFVSTQQTAYDLGFVRALLGYTRLSLIGYGYGARLASWYAATYPDATGAVVADSSTDWSTNTAADTAAGTELRRTQFVAWLARHDDTYHFGTTSAEVSARYEQIRRALARHADPWELDAALAQMITTDRGFAVAAADLRRFATVARSGERALAVGDAAALTALRRRLALTERGQLAAAAKVAASAPDGFSVDLGPVGEVVRCNDLAPAAVSADPIRTAQAAADQRAARQPTWGYLDAVGMCGFWPHPAAPRIIATAGLPSVLMIQAAADPLAGLAGAQSAHAQTPSSVLVVVADSGQHAVALAGVSACADRITLSYLLTGALPGDAVCAGRSLPGDDRVHRFGAPTVDGDPIEDLPPASTAVNPVLAAVWADAVARS